MQEEQERSEKRVKKFVVFPDYMSTNDDDDDDNESRDLDVDQWKFSELTESPSCHKHVTHVYNVQNNNSPNRILNNRSSRRECDIQTSSAYDDDGDDELLNVETYNTRRFCANERKIQQILTDNGANAEFYDNLNESTESGACRNGDAPDITAVSDDEVRQVELFYHGLKSHIFVCTCLAELYLPVSALSNSPQISGVQNAPDQLRYVVMGIPLWLGSGDTRQSDSSTDVISIILAERGTGFTLWKHPVKSENTYRRVDLTFHLLYLDSPASSSKTHQQQNRLVAGLNFFETSAPFTSTTPSEHL